MGLEHQAAVVRELLPHADIRTDQSDVLRVYLGAFFGGIRPLPEGEFLWLIIDMSEEGEISGIAAPPIIEAVADSESEAARLLATELRRLSN
ncbi:MAG: hypothetical protein JNK76_01935 [Planctomycetales bacterium]|nr:hypothetical protein [Planctomycetales bacterium]MBN8625542.1 hypothetical protein [Planctomycetota bacterium]